LLFLFSIEIEFEPPTTRWVTAMQQPL